MIIYLLKQFQNKSSIELHLSTAVAEVNSYLFNELIHKPAFRDATSETKMIELVK